MKRKVVIALVLVILAASLIYLAAPVSSGTTGSEQGYGYGGYHE